MTDSVSQPSLKGNRFFVSWSGGKDSCLAFHRAVALGGTPAFLFTMLTEGAARSRSHGLAREVILAQAAALRVPVVFRAASWQDYESAFIDGLVEIRGRGVSLGVFGDIDLDPHLAWVRRVCAVAGAVPCEPLWKCARPGLLDEFISAGFKATIVSVKDALLSSDFLGRTLDRDLVREFTALGIDPSGEKGEYHTVVTDGPLFSAPVPLRPKEKVLRDGYWFLDLELVEASPAGL
jgi:diphthine-ammonia ligase